MLSSSSHSGSTALSETQQAEIMSSFTAAPPTPGPPHRPPNGTYPVRSNTVSSSGVVSNNNNQTKRPIGTTAAAAAAILSTAAVSGTNNNFSSSSSGGGGGGRNNHSSLSSSDVGSGFTHSFVASSAPSFSHKSNTLPLTGVRSEGTFSSSAGAGRVGGVLGGSAESLRRSLERLGGASEVFRSPLSASSSALHQRIAFGRSPISSRESGDDSGGGGRLGTASAKRRVHWEVEETRTVAVSGANGDGRRSASPRLSARDNASGEQKVIVATDHKISINDSGFLSVPSAAGKPTSALLSQQIKKGQLEETYQSPPVLLISKPTIIIDPSSLSPPLTPQQQQMNAAKAAAAAAAESPSLTPERRRSSVLQPSRSALAELTKELRLRRKRRRLRPEELYTDKDRAAAVNMGNRDIKQSLKVKRQEERRQLLELPDDAKPTTFLALAEKQMQNGQRATALNILTKALELQPTEKRCLAARSRCLLAMGEHKAALRDADAALEVDPNYVLGIQQKAESLYRLGDFEHALLFFHRGARIRPDLEQFRAGVKRSQEAIQNAIGNVRAVPMADLEKLLPILKLNDDTSPPHRPRRGSSAAASGGRDGGGGRGGGGGARGSTRQVADALNNRSKSELFLTTDRDKLASAGLLDWADENPAAGGTGVGKRSNAKAREARQSRELLGELHADKEYLEKMLQHPGLGGSRGDKSSQLIRACAEEALVFLNSRQEFWRQQKPFYARNYEKQMRNSSHRRALREWELMSEKEKREKKEQIKQNLLSLFQEAEKALSAAELSSCVAKCDALERRLQSTAPMLLPSRERDSLLGRSWSLRGTALLRNNDHAAALRCHNADLKLAEKLNSTEAKGRALDNIGKTHVANRKFAAAIMTWEQRLPTIRKSNEKARLYQELGKCYMEIGRPEKARDLAKRSMAEWRKAGLSGQTISACILLAQAEGKLGTFNQRNTPQISSDRSLSLSTVVQQQQQQQTTSAAAATN